MPASGKAFARFTDCQTCIAAGYGWSRRKNKCGGYKNHACDMGMAHGTGLLEPIESLPAKGSQHPQELLAQNTTMDLAVVCVLFVGLFSLLGWIRYSKQHDPGAASIVEWHRKQSIGSNFGEQNYVDSNNRISMQQRSQSCAGTVSRLPAVPQMRKNLANLPLSGILLHSSDKPHRHGRQSLSFDPRPEIKLFARWNFSRQKLQSPRAKQISCQKDFIDVVPSAIIEPSSSRTQIASKSICLPAPKIPQQVSLEFILGASSSTQK